MPLLAGGTSRKSGGASAARTRPGSIADPNIASIPLRVSGITAILARVYFGGMRLAAGLIVSLWCVAAQSPNAGETLRRAAALVDTGKLDEAIRVLEPAADQPGVRKNLAIAYYRTG